MNEENLDSQGPKAQVDMGTMETWAHTEDSWQKMGFCPPNAY